LRGERRRFAGQTGEHLAILTLDARVAPIGLAAIRAHHCLDFRSAGGVGDGGLRRRRGGGRRGRRAGRNCGLSFLAGRSGDGVPVLALQFWQSPIFARLLAQHFGELVDIPLRDLTLDLVGNGGTVRLRRWSGLLAFERLELGFLQGFVSPIGGQFADRGESDSSAVW
jgi:hypothetical protein